MKFSKDLYTKEVVIKAAYAFTDCCYMHLDADEKNYLVSMMPKEGGDEKLWYQKFENELIAQETRRVVAKKTKNIREIIVARALSSTIVNCADGIQEPEEEYAAEDILKDWFEEYE